MNKIDLVERSRMRTDLPTFRAGDTVKVHVKVSEGGRERVQVFQGVVISRRGGGLRESFTVRKISFGVGVERTFPLHAPRVSKIEIVQHGRVRRAKLYYLRERTGRHAKIRERRVTTPEEGAPTPVEEIVPELAAEPVAEAEVAAPEQEATAQAEASAEIEPAVATEDTEAPASPAESEEPTSGA